MPVKRQKFLILETLPKDFAFLYGLVVNFNRPQSMAFNPAIDMHTTEQDGLKMLRCDVQSFEEAGLIIDCLLSVSPALPIFSYQLIDRQ